jgi:hypothetical protein
MEKSERRISRRRGGQPGNQNALKHGRHTARAKAERRWMRDLVEQSAAHLRVLTATGAEAGFVSRFDAIARTNGEGIARDTFHGRPVRRSQ